jgi:hypothetical protein
MSPRAELLRHLLTSRRRTMRRVFVDPVPDEIPDHGTNTDAEKGD